MNKLILWAALIPLVMLLSGCPGLSVEYESTPEPVLITELSAYYIEIYEETVITVPTLAGFTTVLCIPSTMAECSSATFSVEDVQDGYEVTFGWWPEAYDDQYIRIWYLK